MAQAFPEWTCSGCGAASTALPLAHPLFTQAPVCEDCLRIYHLGEFTQEEGHEVFTAFHQMHREAHALVPEGGA